MINNYQSINLTKLDILDDLDEVKIGVAYKINGTRLLPGQMPSTLEDLYKVEVEYETMPGWKESIEKCTDFDSLPDNAKAYGQRRTYSEAPGNKEKGFLVWWWQKEEEESNGGEPPYFWSCRPRKRPQGNAQSGSRTARHCETAQSGSCTARLED
jgi:hypothetical protein